MEQVLDHTYLRPGPIVRAAGIAIVALGVGLGTLAVCWGLSFFWHREVLAQKLDALADRIETLSGAENYVSTKVNTLTGQVAALAGITQQIDALTSRIATLQSQSAIWNGNTKTSSGDPIKHEVTVFAHVTHDVGEVGTGWAFRDGGSSSPYWQYCYYRV